MGRKKVIDKKESMSVHNDELNRQKDEQGFGKEVVLRDNSGGSISGKALTVQDKKSFNKWLTELQAKNIFIGKDYIQRATEYETDDKVIDSEVMDDVSQEDVEALGTGAIDIDELDLENLDIESMDLEELENIEEALRQVDIENKFIDHCIISNTTKKLLGKSPEEIKEVAESEMKTYHQNSDYSTKVNIISSINHAETQLLIAREEKEKKVQQITS